MPCQEIESWTFSELVGAFLDIAIAFLLLCASSIAYLASKVLALFGSHLPCPCNGLFCCPKKSSCWQKVLVHCPLQNVSSVQFSVKSRFPFNSMWDKCSNYMSNIPLLDETGCENGYVGIKGEATCSSSVEGSGEMGVGCARAGKQHVRVATKGRVPLRKKIRRDLRHRRKGDLGAATVSLSDPFQSGVQEAHPESPSSVNKMLFYSKGDAHAGDNLRSRSGALPCSEESSMDTALPESFSYGFELSEPDAEGKRLEKKSHSNKLTLRTRSELSINDDVNDTIRDLKQRIEAERAAHAALSLELEKERTAAAGAAEEAMAMILRLQEEKALIEMEARQNQRMIEEKSAYDYEEMNILKEIIVRREREKHFLEKEVEGYRKMFFDSEQSDYDMLDMGSANEKAFSLPNPDDILLLQTPNNSIIKKETVENENKVFENEMRSVKSDNCILTLGDNLSILKLDEKDTRDCKEEMNKNFEEKEPISWDEGLFNQERELHSIELLPQYNMQSMDLRLSENDIASFGNVQHQNDSINESECFDTKLTETSDYSGGASPYKVNKSEKHENGSVSGLHDIHVVDDGKFITEACEDVKKDLSLDAAFSSPGTVSTPLIRRLGTEQHMSRSCSAINISLPPIYRQRGKSLLTDMRRNSMSAVDYERFKIDNEVGWLRERLKVIQEGREKLNVPTGLCEKENAQVKLLETILHQLKEIHHLAGTGKAMRRASLPHLSSKPQVTSKKSSWQ